MSQNLSYSQIQGIGNYLKERAKEENLGFLKKYSFEEQLLSKISKDCFRPYYTENLKEKLMSTPFSLIVDNATFSRENFCALKVKFLEKEFNKELNTEISSIKNKLIGIATLKESSTGKVMREILEDKLFSDKQIIMNLKGFTHDNGSSLTGPNIGLSSLLRKSGANFFDLNDPCHGLNLIIKKSVQILPKEIVEFVPDITNYFTSPQKRASLKRVQEQNKLPTLFPIKLGSTRWLSLGQALTRLIDIWESLVLYFQEVTPKKDSKKERKYTKKTKKPIEKEDNTSKLLKLLNDKNFYFQIKFLGYIVNTLNRFNIILQNPKLDISGVKTQINKCWSFILDLVAKPEILEKPKIELLNYEWENEELDDIAIKTRNEFINLIVTEIDSKYEFLQNESIEIQESFSEIFIPFLRKILNLLAEYLPLEDEVIEIADFIELKDTYPILKEKIFKFCEKFNAIEEQEKQALKDELIHLKDFSQAKLAFYRNSSLNLLHMWDLLEKQENFRLLPRLVRLAEILPTSSAPLEQSFSIIKLLKTDLRNNLTESSLEGLILVGEEYREKKDIAVTDKMTQLYSQAKVSFNEKKNSSPKEKNNQYMNIEVEPDIPLIKDQSSLDVFEGLSKELEKSFRIEEEPLNSQTNPERIEEHLIPVIQKNTVIFDEDFPTQILRKRTPSFQILLDDEELSLEKKVKK